MRRLKKNIILEGPDLSGKTTLRNTLQTLIDCTIREERIGRIASPMEKTLTACLDIAHPERRILDRCHFISDMVCDPAFINRPSIFEPKKEEILAFLKQEATIIYLEPAIYEIESRYATRGDDLRTLPEILKAHTAYQEWFDENESKLDCIRLRGPFMTSQVIAELTKHQTIETLLEPSTIVPDLIETADWTTVEVTDYLIVIGKLTNGVVKSASVKKTGTSADLALGKALIQNILYQEEMYKHESM